MQLTIKKIYTAPENNIMFLYPPAKIARFQLPARIDALLYLPHVL